MEMHQRKINLNLPLVARQSEGEGTVTRPVLQDEGVTCLYVQHNNLYLLALTRCNTNAAALLLFLHRLVGVLGATEGGWAELKGEFSNCESAGRGRHPAFLLRV